MAILEYITSPSLFFILISFFIFIYRIQNNRSIIPTKWPVLGMVPAFLVNSHRLNDYVTEFLLITGGVFMWKGPWFTRMDMLITTYPLDIQHVLSKNFNNYPKGDEYRIIFDIFGEGIFNSDGEVWERHRKITMSVLKDTKFHSLLETVIWNKIETGLLPVFESCSRNREEVDLQEVFDRFTFDTTCKLFMNIDPQSLSLDFPYIPCQKAFLDVEEAILHRHYTPPSLWKLNQLLRWGNEKKLKDAWERLDDFIYKGLEEKQNEYNNTKWSEYQQEEEFLVLRSLMRGIKDQFGEFEDPTKLLRDSLFSLMLAAKDNISSALSWFFYIIAKNQKVEDKILEEINTHLKVKLGERWCLKDLDKMVYLHGTLNESLRLFPPVPYNHRSPLQPDILPSGYKVDKDTKIILCFYSMGRMKSIWGEDCMEFKPERWINSMGGGIKHEPSYKFIAFNTGPRACLGKDMALYQLKILSAIFIYHYQIEVVENHKVLPSNSVVLQMKHGLKVRLTKRRDMN